MAEWQQVLITLPQEDALTLSTWLEDYALAVSMSDAGVEPLYQQQPTQTPLWQMVHIQALFTAEENLTALINTIKSNYPQLSAITSTRLEEQDWVRQTQRQFPAQCFGEQLWIVPSWETPPANATTLIRLDPGLAFGTGTHATTTMCLEWLTTHPLTHKTLVDFGCGSGILALSALALGAAEVWAIDHDPQALLAAQNNAALNDFRITNHLHIGDINNLPQQSVDVVIANILAQPLCELAPILSALVTNNGYLVLSGLLTQDINDILAVYQPTFQLQTQTEKDDWACLVLQKKLTFPLK